MPVHTGASAVFPKNACEREQTLARRKHALLAAARRRYLAKQNQTLDANTARTDSWAGIPQARKDTRLRTIASQENTSTTVWRLATAFWNLKHLDLIC